MEHVNNHFNIKIELYHQKLNFAQSNRHDDVLNFDHKIYFPLHRINMTFR